MLFKITNNFVHIIDAALTESGLYLTMANTFTNLTIMGNHFDVPKDGYPIYLSGMSNHAGELLFQDNIGWGPIYDAAATMNVEDYHCGTTFTNTGQAAAVILTLPPAEKGIWFGFVTTEDEDMEVNPDGTETINHQGAGEHIDLATQGSSVTIKCFVDGEWEIIGGYHAGAAYTFA